MATDTKNNKKMGIFLFILVLLTLGGGWYWMKKKKEQEQREMMQRELEREREYYDDLSDDDIDEIGDRIKKYMNAIACRVGRNLGRF